ncbi:MAG: phosphatase PAP2 family protein [Rhodospirillaceae bacterium]|nr:phosphatase PAP2 family protein [Rhodospirillaceae bacterium]
MRSHILAAWLMVFGASEALALSDAPYVMPGQIDAISLLAPPPAPNSEFEKRELATVLAAQKARSPALIKRALEDRDFLGFATVLGANFTLAKIPLAAEFIRKVTRETTQEIDRVKDCWPRPRPFVVSTEIQPPGDAAQGTVNRPGAAMANAATQASAPPCLPAASSAYSHSYPSGAAGVGMTAAILLAAMVPEKRSELFLRGQEYGENRINLGLHFPSDIEAGRILASAMIALMMPRPAFNTDLASAKAEVRAALGLPP